MSDNIPFDVQMEIFKRVSNIKSLIQFRSVSKQWKSFIDSSDFIKGYGARDTDPHSHILRYKIKNLKAKYTSCLIDDDIVSYISDESYMDHEVKYIRLVEDDIETFKVQQQVSAPFVVSPLMNKCRLKCVIGACHGLMCFFGHYNDKNILVIWNPSIGKSFGIALPGFDYRISFAFGVAPVTCDPTVVKLVCADNMPWHVEVFRLSTGVWNVIPSCNLPRQSQTIRFEPSTHVVIDKLIYWGASERTNTDYGEYHMVVSFNLSTEEFKVVNLPDCLKKGPSTVSVSKLGGSLVVCGCTTAEEASVWVMDNDSSFRKLYTIGAPVNLNNIRVLGLKKTGEIIYATRNSALIPGEVLHVYDPCSQQIKNLCIFGVYRSFFMGSYKESLLLLDQLDSQYILPQ